MKKEFLIFPEKFFIYFMKSENNLFKKVTEFYDSGNYQMAITYFDSLIHAGKSAVKFITTKVIVILS